MMVDASRLSETLQSLVDARLDTVDRMLLGRVNRQDRLAIVREVETQIFDLIERHSQAELDRDDLLAILGRLDPPEAYLPEEGAAPIGRPSPRPPIIPTRVRLDRVPFWSGVLGLGSMGMCVVLWVVLLLEESIQSEFAAYALFFGTMSALLLSGMLAVILSAYARFQGSWSIVGLITGVISLLIGLVSGAYVMTWIG